jgi:quercetin dioxygenase-like cupin family protein
MFRKKSEEKLVPATARNTKRYIQAALICLAPALFVLLLVGIFPTATASATPSSPGITSTPVAAGVLPDPVRLKFKQTQDQGFGDGLDVSDLSIVHQIVEPGAYFGWHQHPGPSWIMVTQGTLTFYNGDDPTCTGRPVSAGQAYFDPGDHTHNARNETDQIVEEYVVRTLPHGVQPRIDEPAPGNCPF